MKTKTQEIFELNSCPFRNPFQGQDTKITFVCSIGLLRSPTAARIASEYDINARSAGSDLKRALVPLSLNLVMWSDYVIFMKRENYDDYIKEANDLTRQALTYKVRTWSIDDDYEYMQPELVREIKANLETFIEKELE